MSALQVDRTGKYVVCINATPPESGQVGRLAQQHDEGMDMRQTFVITVVCFALGFLATSLHLLVMFVFKKVRYLYGITIAATLCASLMAYAFQLASCLLQCPSAWFVAASLAANYAILMVNTSNTVCAITLAVLFRRGASMDPLTSLSPFVMLRLQHAGPRDIHWVKDICLMCLNTLFVFGLPLVLCFLAWHGLGSFLDLDHCVSNSSVNTFDSITCNLIPSQSTNVWLFWPLFVLLFVQFVSILASLRVIRAPKGAQMLAVHDRALAARFWICTKYFCTNTLVTALARLALHYKMIEFWHVYTLTCSLQGIFITINCIFSRPVLDLVHQWKEEKSARDLKLLDSHLRSSSELDQKQERYSCNNNTIQHATTESPLKLTVDNV